MGKIDHLSDRIKRLNVGARFRFNEKTWPPTCVKDYTPLVLIHHQDQRSAKESAEIAKLVHSGEIQVVSKISNSKRLKLEVDEPTKEFAKTSKITKDISEILVTLEAGNSGQLILIEGAPGIGKTVLLHEIAYQWGDKILLQSYKLVLLVRLRDPIVQQMITIQGLLQLFCKGDRNAETIANECSDYLFSNSGKDIIFLLDGYDEFPTALQENSLIGSIINREVLPDCGLIVSSRPHASINLREQASIQVEILGFTEEEREHYIQQALKGQPNSIKELTNYLEQHWTISSLCFVPFNMVVLIFIYKQGVLPNNSIELYNLFICLTVCRHLAKLNYANSLNNTITDIKSLPEPCKRIVKQLSKLSLETLNDNKLIFTLSDIETTCPDIITNPEAINGFGLLQAVEHLGLTGTTKTFNFVHFSIQEFLAAHYVAHLTPENELLILKKFFWSTLHFNMFAIYVALTKGQHPSFKEFLSGGNKNIVIADQFLSDQLKCLRLFRCFYEAGDEEMCKAIENAKTFCHKDGKRVELSDTRFSHSELDCVTLFLTCASRKEWKQGLNLYRCYIQDQGIRILHRRLKISGIILSKLWLDTNGLTSSSSSLISEIVVNCKVKVLWIDSNEIVGEDDGFHTMFSDPSSILELIHMADVKLSSIGAIKLFSSLAIGNKLKTLWITANEISDEASQTICETLKNNTSLVRLKMGGNPFGGESAQRIVSALLDNTTLKELGLPGYSEDVKAKIAIQLRMIHEKRKMCECEVKLEVTYW